MDRKRVTVRTMRSGPANAPHVTVIVQHEDGGSVHVSNCGMSDEGRRRWPEPLLRAQAMDALQQLRDE